MLCGATKSSPVAAIQVEMGEMPLLIVGTKIMMSQVNLQGHNVMHPAKSVVHECWEYNKVKLRCFVWICNTKAREIGLDQIQYFPTVSYSKIAQRLFIMPSFD